MARYPLIIKDTTYIILVQEAAKHGKTLGKYLNEILNAKARELEGKKGQTDISMNPRCMTCLEYLQRNSWCRLLMKAVKATHSCERYHR